MKQIAAILLGAGLWPACLMAQEQAKDSTMNRTVTVENQYNPQVTDAFKINVLPKIEEPAVNKQHIDYADGVRPLTGWTATPMKSVSEEEVQAKAPRGYARVAYGNRNNSDARLSYLWDITHRDQLDLSASFYGMYGDVDRPLSDKGEEWKARFFRTDASLGYTHRFNKMALSVGGNFASQVFGYLPELDVEGDISRQHYTLGEGFVGVASVTDEWPVSFSLQTGFRSFNRKYALPMLGDGTESILHTIGHVYGKLNNEQQVGIQFAMDNVMYGNAGLDDYSLVQFNPYYSLSSDAVRLRLGAHVDWQTANGSGLKVAPDVAFDYLFGHSYALYVQAGGGAKLNDFRGLNELSPYWMQSLQIHTSYTQLDAQAGLKATPLPELGFRIYGGYRITKDENFLLCQKLYKLGDVVQEKAKVAYAGAAVDYKYKDWFSLSLSGVYQNWNMKQEYKPYLMLKPELGIDFSAKAKVFRGCMVSADYRYESRVKAGNLPQEDAINDLSLSAEYQLFHRLNVFAGFHNLLNQFYLMENAYPVQGFHVMAGASVRF